MINFGVPLSGAAAARAAPDSSGLAGASYSSSFPKLACRRGAGLLYGAERTDARTIGAPP